MTDPNIEAACEDITKGLKTHRGYTAREITSASDFVRRLRQYNAAHLAYEMTHDEAVDALLLLFGHTHLVSSTDGKP